jgi:hypothetical protein
MSPAAKAKSRPGFKPVFAALKKLLQPHAASLAVAADKPGNYCLETRSPSNKGKPMFFGAVQVGKNYVSFHLMPVYIYADLAACIGPELRRRMQGKSCFNFTTLEDVPLAELRSLVKAGLARYRQDKLL